MSLHSQIKIKLLIRGNKKNKHDAWLRQFPSNVPVWGNCHYIFDDECTDYDWLVVYDDLPPMKSERFSKRIENLQCDSKNTLLVTSEPSTIKTYGSKFLDQFGHVLTTQEPWAINHKNVIYSQCGYRWFYGIGSNHLKNYDEISQTIPCDKTKSISTVCSDKKQKNTVHFQRYQFTKKLKEAIPELEVYGHGVRELDDKADAIDTYKYHVVIENICNKDHWSEKLADAFLGHSFPFYYGCTNIFDYFPKNSLVQINPYDIEASIEKIRNAVNSNFYEKYKSEIAQSRKLVLEKYNFFAVVSSIVEKNNDPYNDVPTQECIRSRRLIRRKNPLNFIEYFLERYKIKIKHFLKNF